MPISKTGLERLAEIIWEIIGDRSIRKFAKDIGCHHTSISRALEGKAIPDIETLHKIAKNSQYRASELIAILLEESEAEEKPEQTVFTLEEALGIARTLPSDKKKQLIQLLFEEMTSEERRKLLKGLIDVLF